MKRIRLKNSAVQEKLDKLTGCKFTADISKGLYYTDKDCTTGERCVFVHTSAIAGMDDVVPITLAVPIYLFESIASKFDSTLPGGWNKFPCDDLPADTMFQVECYEKKIGEGNRWTHYSSNKTYTDDNGNLLWDIPDGGRHFEYKALVRLWQSPIIEDFLGDDE